MCNADKLYYCVEIVNLRLLRKSQIYLQDQSCLLMNCGPMLQPFRCYLSHDISQCQSYRNRNALQNYCLLQQIHLLSWYEMSPEQRKITSLHGSDSSATHKVGHYDCTFPVVVVPIDSMHKDCFHCCCCYCLYSYCMKTRLLHSYQMLTTFVQQGC